MSDLRDRCKGVLYGQAVGDALGLGTEFMSRAQVVAHYPHGLNHYHQIIQDGHRSQWASGDWTDDTDQMLCILDSLIAEKKLVPQDIAHRIYTWAANGGVDVGQLVAAVVYSPNYLDDPRAVAQAVWESKGRQVAPNGAVMRTSVLGVWDYPNVSQVKANAEQVCQLTHADPRCVGSCVAVCVAINLLLQGVTDFDELFTQVSAASAGYDDRLQEYLDWARTADLQVFDLDEGLNPGEPNRIGYTLKALGAGFWALKNARSFQAGLLPLIHEGGDADTNGAVAGALLGAKFGLAGIPSEWINGLYAKPELESKIGALLEVMKI